MDPKAIVVLEGDQTGQELLEESLRVLDADVIGSTSTYRASTSRSNAAAQPRTASCTKLPLRFASTALA